MGACLDSVALDIFSAGNYKSCMPDFRKVILLLIGIVFAVSKSASAMISYDNWPQISGQYLGQELPGRVAEIFAPGVISTERSEINSVFSPDGNEFYFTAWTVETGTKIMVTEQIDGHWTVPTVASFSKDYSNVDPAISYDGKKMFFGARRPRPGESEIRERGFDIWFSDRTETGWGEAQYLGPIINSGDSQVHATTTQDGVLYFQAIREDSYGKADIYRSRLESGAYQIPENLGPVINSELYEGDVFVAKDESYLIVSINGRADSFGGADLYVSFRDTNDSWSPLKNMGSAINSEEREFCPMLTPDGKYFFFTSKRNGEGDIFWIDAKIIEALRDH